MVEKKWLIKREPFKACCCAMAAASPKDSVAAITRASAVDTRSSTVSVNCAQTLLLLLDAFFKRFSRMCHLFYMSVYVINKRIKGSVYCGRQLTVKGGAL